MTRIILKSHPIRIAALLLLCASAVSAQLRVAVFPFQNISKSPKYNWLGNGFCESLNTDIGDASDTITVTERAELIAAMKAQGFRLPDLADETKALQIAKHLGVQKMVMGSYDVTIPDVKVSAKVIDVASGQADSKNLYSAAGKFGMNNIFAMYGQIARKALVSFGQKVNEEETGATNKATVNIDAYEPYIKAVVQFTESSTDKDYQEAIDLFQKAIAVDSNYAFAYAGAAKAYAKMGRLQDINFKTEEKTNSYKMATKYGQRAVKLDKNLGTAWVSLALIYRETKERDKLVEAARRAIQIKPSQYDAYDILADAFTKKFFPDNANIDSAIANRKRAVDIEPKFAAGFRGLGNDYLEKGDYKNAELAYKKAIDLNPKHAGSHDFLGQVYFNKGDFDNAKKEFLEALSLDKKSAFAASHLGDVYSLEGNYKEAIEMYREALQSNPNAAFALNGLAWLYIGAQDKSFRDATKAIENAAAAVKFSNNKNAAYISTLAEAYRAANDNDKAKVVVQGSADLEPNNLDYKESLGRFWNNEKESEYIYALRQGTELVKHGRPDDGIKILQVADKLKPKYPPILIAMGKAYESKGDFKQAYDAYYNARVADKEGRYKAIENAKLNELEKKK